jgi:hypothetical protein
MSESMGDEDRIAYLSGDAPDALSPAERAELDEMRALLADPAMWAEPDPSLEQRVVDEIAAAGGQHGGTDELAARRARRSRGWLVAAAAAVVAVLAGIGIGIAASGNNANQPQQFTAALQATPLAPNASGHATMTKTTGGWRITINATGLPRRDNGKYYEAWLKNSAGVLVPIGTFNEPKHVTLWAGVPPSDFPTLSVTRQRVGGGEESSGQVVLAGQAVQVR